MEQSYKGIRYKFFWDGPFSNWHPSPFKVDGVEYNCGEQYMMHQKALTFKDQVSADRILNTDSPNHQKRLGRQVEGFDPEKWTSVRYELVKKGLREKFIQNPELKNCLLRYKGYQIVEASPYDRIWGIGFFDSDAIDHFEEWGENLLGKMLTELSYEL